MLPSTQVLKQGSWSHKRSYIIFMMRSDKGATITGVMHTTIIRLIPVFSAIICRDSHKS